MNAAKSMKIAMAQREINQTQLAEKIGITQGALSALASRKNWNAESMQKVAKALGMKVSEFVALGED